MKQKQIIILALILALLAGAVFYLKSQKPPELVSEEYAALGFSFAEEAVAALRISKGAVSAENPASEIAKEGDVWKIKSAWNARADQEKIHLLVQDILSLKGELRGSSKELFSDFGIGDDQGIRMTFSDVSGKPLADLMVGLKKADYRYLFVRESGSEKVFMTEAPLLNKIGLFGDPEKEGLNQVFFASLDVVQMDTEKVTGLTLTRFKDGKPVVTAKVTKDTDPADAAKKKWKYHRTDLPFNLEAAKIQSFLREHVRWKAQTILDPKGKDYGFNRPYWTMEVAFEDGNNINLTAGDLDMEKRTYPINVSGEPAVFQLSKFYFDEIDIDESRFFETNPFHIEASKIEKLVVHTDKGEKSFAPKEKTWPALDNYLKGIKDFAVARLLYDAHESGLVKSPAAYWIEVKLAGETASVILDAGEVIPGDKKERAALVRGSKTAFAIGEDLFNRLFPALESLAEPPAPSTAPASSVPASPEAQPAAVSKS